MQCRPWLGVLALGLIPHSGWADAPGSALFLAHFDRPEMTADFAAGGLVSCTAAAGARARASGWDRLCPTITCRSFVQGKGERLDVDMVILPPLLVRVGAVTQVPGAIVSACKQETQFVLPHNLDCAIDGSVDEEARTVRLTVATDKPCEVIAWWPKAWGPAQVSAGNAVCESTRVTYGTERFVRFGVGTGVRKVTVAPTR